MQAKISIQLIAPDKVIKQSRDLKYVLFLSSKSRYCTAQLLAEAQLARAPDMKGSIQERVSSEFIMFQML